jgi:hypothetical protein
MSVRLRQPRGRWKHEDECRKPNESDQVSATTDLIAPEGNEDQELLYLCAREVGRVELLPCLLVTILFTL